MQINKRSVDYVREVRAMRARYIGGLLSSGWDVVLGFFGSADQFLKRMVITASRNPDQIPGR
jgi:hypothetical protein